MFIKDGVKELMIMFTVLPNKRDTNGKEVEKVEKQITTLKERDLTQNEKRN